MTWTDSHDVGDQKTAAGRPPVMPGQATQPSKEVRQGRIVNRRKHLQAYVGFAAIGLLAWYLIVHLNAADSQIVVFVVTWAIAATGLNLIAGLGGYPSLLQAGFYAIGAYGSAALLIHHHGFVVSVVLCVLLAAVVGLLLGLVFIRTRGQYFSIGTLFCGVIVTLLITNWQSLTGGAYGLTVPLGLSLSSMRIMIAASLAVALGVFYAIANMRLGRRLVSIRDDEDLAEHVGVPTAVTKLIAFSLSAAFAAFAGVLFAQYNGALSSDSFTFLVGFLMFVAVGVGGSGRTLGPLLGCAFVEGLPQIINLNSGWSEVIIGAIFVVVMITAPGGFMSALDRMIGVARSLPQRSRRSELARGHQ